MHILSCKNNGNIIDNTHFRIAYSHTHTLYVKVSFSRVTRSEDGDEVITKTVKRTLFQRGNAYPQKKVLTFNRYSDDFPFQVFYGELDFLSNEELR